LNLSSHQKVLVLTHEFCKAQENRAYLSYALRPVRPLVIDGQSARAEPQVALKGRHQQGGNDVVGNAWIDVLLPYMSDERFPPEQLFLIFEQDFRFYLNDARGMEARFTLPGIAQMALADVECRRADDPKLGDRGDESTELKDLVAMATQASRWKTDAAPMGMGDMIWASWDRGCSGGRHGKYKVETDKRINHPGLGNYLWMIRTRAARRMLAEQAGCGFGRSKREHVWHQHLALANKNRKNRRCEPINCTSW
jgi:hypothetical protein